MRIRVLALASTAALLSWVMAAPPVGATPSPGLAVGQVSASGTAATLLSVQGQVLGVAATSSSNAWAVGYSGYLEDDDFQMLIAHWNGTRWSLVKNLPLGEVTQISMDSPADAWAIAETITGEPYVIHWNGKTWSQDKSVPKVVAYLNALVAVDGDVWVTGTAGGPDGKTNAQVMLHRTGGHWYVVPVPAAASYLDSFAATSRTSIWAGGSLLIHWNGAEWKVTSVLKSAGLNYIASMAPGPDGSVWAVGTNSSEKPFSLHWNGKAWTKVPFPPASGLGDTFNSVAPIPGGTAWAVGSNTNSNDSKRVALILHWSGKAWTAVKAPSTTMTNVMLYDVTATSPSNGWAVGVSTCIQEHCTQYALILRWNGKTWS
jgi:hypothetical protein